MTTPKELLKQGTTVTTREGIDYIIIGDRFVSNQGWLNINDYDENLKDMSSLGVVCDIMSITYENLYGLDYYEGSLMNKSNNSSHKLIWERSDYDLNFQEAIIKCSQGKKVINEYVEYGYYIFMNGIILYVDDNPLVGELTDITTLEIESNWKVVE